MMDDSADFEIALTINQKNLQEKLPL